MPLMPNVIVRRGQQTMKRQLRQWKMFEARQSDRQQNHTQDNATAGPSHQHEETRLGEANEGINGGRRATPNKDST